jgi:hypothetical protein
VHLASAALNSIICYTFATASFIRAPIASALPHPSHHLHSLTTPHSTLQHYARRLSGGAFLGFYHMGVVRALWTEGLLPRVISGASAGSIMTAIIG